MGISFTTGGNIFPKRRRLLQTDLAALGVFLRNLYPRDTVTNVAADVHVSTRTVANWLDGSSAPRLDHFIRLVDAYGPSVIAAAFPAAPRWLDEAVRAEERRVLAERAAAIQARLEKLP